MHTAPVSLHRRRTTREKLEVAIVAVRNKLPFLQPYYCKHSEKAQTWVLSSAGFDSAHVLPVKSETSPYLCYSNGDDC
jgi:hypothetical protein